MILGTGYSFCFNFFKYLKSLSKLTIFYLGLCCTKDGDPHYKSFTTSRTPSRPKLSTPLLKISSCTFGTGYGRENIGFTSTFKSKSTGSVFQAPSVPSNNSLDLCNTSRN